MNKPLTKWYCDVCGKTIDDVKRGYVIWKKTEDFKSHSFKIIHQTKCDLKDYRASAALEDFLGDNGLVYILSKLSLGPIKKRLSQEPHCDAAELDEFVDFIRRVQTPFYEEARRHFSNPDLLEDYSDANEVFPYFPEQLQKIVKQFDDER